MKKNSNPPPPPGSKPPPPPAPPPPRGHAWGDRGDAVSRHGRPLCDCVRCQLAAGADQISVRVLVTPDGLADAPGTECKLVVNDPGRAGGGSIVLRGLPMPPSVNGLFANTKNPKGGGAGFAALKLPAGARMSASQFNAAVAAKSGGGGRRGRVKTSGYRAWLNHAGTLVNIQRPAPIAGRVGIRLLCDEHEGGADPDNLWKASLDLLVNHKLIADDNRKHVRHLELDWRDDGAAGLDIIVSPWPPKS